MCNPTHRHMYLHAFLFQTLKTCYWTSSRRTCHILFLWLFTDFVPYLYLLTYLFLHYLTSLILLILNNDERMAWIHPRALQRNVCWLRGKWLCLYHCQPQICQNPKCVILILVNEAETQFVKVIKPWKTSHKIRIRKIHLLSCPRGDL